MVCYYIGIHNDAQIRHVVDPRATILNLTTQAGNTGYGQISTLNPRLPDLVAHWEAKEGCKFFPIVLMGWSAGCQALRTQLLSAASSPSELGYPQAMIALDGIHSSSPPQAWQIDTWRDWFLRCGGELGPQGIGLPRKQGLPIFVATCTQIQPPTYRSVRATLQDVTDWELQPGDPEPWPGVPGFYASGNVEIWSWPGAGQDDHSWQQNFLGPFHLWQVCNRLGFAGQTPASPPGTVEGKPVDLKTTPPTAAGLPLAPRVALAAVPAALCGWLLWSRA